MMVACDGQGGPDGMASMPDDDETCRRERSTSETGTRDEISLAFHVFSRESLGLYLLIDYLLLSTSRIHHD